MTGLLAVGGVRSAAQQPQLKRPNDAPPEKPAEIKKPKKVKGPRALGLVQFGGSGKATLIPVAILVDGKFYDASAYKADPIPMALESGTVYEAEQSGDSEGLFTVNGALHSKSPASPQPWIGSGTYLPQGAEAPKTTRKAENVPVGLNDSGDEPPRLTRTSKAASAPDTSSGTAASGAGSGDKAGAKDPAAAQTAGGASTGSASGQQAPATADKPTNSGNKEPVPVAQTGPGQVSPGQTPPSQTSPTQGSPASTSGSKSSPGQTSTSQTSASPTSASEAEGSYYRPTLRRGKPTAAAPPEEDVSGTVKGGKVDSTPTAISATAASASAPLRTVAAISDAGGPEPQTYNFFWKTGEEEERRGQMLALAGNEVRAYAAALVKNQILAHPVTPKGGTGGRRAAVKQAEPVFENVQFRGFDVWTTSQPVLILSAEARIPGSTSVEAAAEPFSVMLVVRTDIYGNLRKLYSGVTDKYHLDVTPRLELIDVVDADGDGRGELLFRETSDVGSGYMIYRATADKLWKMFDSLNAE
ncbi:MAG: hypothetical protein ABR880_15195 [Candidatus Sulfotelmatobacter sp.]|jgi:hypothetical protein